MILSNSSQRRQNKSPRGVRILILGTCDYATSCGKKDPAAVIKGVGPETWTPGCPGGPNLITEILKIGQFLQLQPVKDELTGEGPKCVTLAAVEMQEGATSQRRQKRGRLWELQEARHGFSAGASGRDAPLPTPWLWPSETPAGLVTDRTLGGSIRVILSH